MDVTVYEYHGQGIRVVRGVHSISADSGVPHAVRHYRNVNQAYAAERGAVRALLALMM